MVGAQQIELGENKPLSITELTKALNQLVERHFSEVSFVGEISQMTLASSGHLYLTIKDSNSQVRAVMWRGTVARLKFQPEEGAAVICIGRANVYSKSGQLQIILSHMEPAGIGDLHKKFLQLKAKLEKEGLFQVDRKRELPYLPSSVGVVTSKSGAVIHDIMVKIQERMPNVQVYLIDVRVQGVGAAEEISAAIDDFNKRKNIEVLIVGRGGGSLEDLWPFNEELVVRAIFRSKIPIVSAVGHEVDVTLSDLVADVRAPTPTAAAEMIVPDKKELVRRITELNRVLKDYERWLNPLVQEVDQLSINLNRTMTTLFDTASMHIEKLELKLQTVQPGHLIAAFNQRLSALAATLYQETQNQVTRFKVVVSELQGRLQGLSTSYHISSRAEKLTQLAERLELASLNNTKQHRLKLSGLGAHLESLNYKKTMARGYSIIRKDGKIITKDSDLLAKDMVDISLYSGSVKAEITSKE